MEANKSQLEDAWAISPNRYRKIWMDFYEAKDADIVFLSVKSCLNIALNRSTFFHHLFGKIQLIYTTKYVAFKEIYLWVLSVLEIRTDSFRWQQNWCHHEADVR